MVIEPNRVAAAAGIPARFSCAEIRIFHAGIHIRLANAEENEEGLNLFWCGPELQRALFGDVERFVNLIDTVGIFADRLAKLQTAKCHVAGFVLGTEAKNRSLRFVLGDHFPHAKEGEHAALTKEM